MTFKEILKKKKFIVTAELSPPKGIKTEPALNIADKIKKHIDGINVTDNQRAVMRMSSMAFSHILSENGNEPIMQICCRDKNRLALQSEILGAYSLGIRNISVMTGDHPAMGDHPDSKPVFDLDSIQLLETIKKLSHGISLADKKIDHPLDLCIGAVTNPFADPFELQMMKLQKKIEVGVDFFQTQPFFEKESIVNFLDKTKNIDKKILIGIVPLKSADMANFINKNIMLGSIPESIITRLKNSSNSIEEGIKIAGELINNIKNIVSGIHIMPIGVQQYLPELLKII